MFYCTLPGQQIVMLHQFIKKSQKIPPREESVSLGNGCKRCKMLTHDELKAKALRNPRVQAEYNALEAEFAWLGELLQARNRAGLTQTEVAERMGTTPSAVARLEAGGGHQKRPPVYRHVAQICRSRWLYGRSQARPLHPTCSCGGVPTEVPRACWAWPGGADQEGLIPQLHRTS